MKADGCYVQVLTAEINGTEEIAWFRDCCSANNYPCTEIHEEAPEGFTGRNDQSW